MTAKETFFHLCSISDKVIAHKPEVGKMVDILITEKHMIIYSHSKGNHWNLGGTHWYYLHDINTGLFIGSYNGIGNAKIIQKERFLKADYIKYYNIFKEKQSRNESNKI